MEQPSLPLRCVGICGIGQMGAAAAVCFERAGYEVLLWGRDPRKLSAVRSTLDQLCAWVNRHVGPAPRAGGSVELASDLAALDDRCELVMDAIGEVLEQKAELFARMRRAGERNAIFITTTSGLSVTEIGRRSDWGPNLAGTHFWNPPHLMPLVEVVRGEETRPEIIDRVCEIVRSIGKTPVRVQRDVPGFIGNRLLHALWREAIDLVQCGIASAEDVDRVARLTFGLRLPAVGPLENMDLVGLDLVHTIHEYLLAELCAETRPPALLAEHVRDGELGMKTGRGFYDWTRRDPKELIERRDRQIVKQLQFLREIDAT